MEATLDIEYKDDGLVFVIKTQPTVMRLNVSVDVAKQLRDALSTFVTTAEKKEPQVL